MSVTEGRTQLLAGRDLQRRGDHGAALAHFNALLLDAPRNPDFLAERGHALRELGRLEEAEAVYREVLALRPDDSGALAGLGHVARHWADPAGALAYFRRAAEGDPANPYIRTSIAHALRELRRVDEAEAAYRDVLAISPNHAGAWHGLGHIARGRADLGAAVGHFERASAADPRDLNARVELGTALCDVARLDDAAAAFRFVLAAAPDHAGALLGLARVARLNGDAAATHAALDAALEAQPRSPSVLSSVKDVLSVELRFDWKAEVQGALAILADPGTPPRALLDAATTLVEYGVIGPLDSALARIEARAPRARQLRLAARALQRSGLARALPGEDATADRESEELNALSGCTSKLVAGAETLVVVFAGRGNRFFLSFDVLHRVMRASGASILYLRDLERTRYMGGVVGLGADVVSSVAALRDIAARAGARRIVTIGLCTGCGGALRYGLALGAEASLCFGPAISVPDDAALRPEARPKRALLQGAGKREVLELFRAAPSPPGITVIFGADAAPDAADARALSEIPGTVLAGIPGCAEHDCVSALLVRGLLAPVLNGFVAGGQVPPDVLERLVAPVPPAPVPPPPAPPAPVAPAPQATCRICGGHAFGFGGLTRARGAAPPFCLGCKSVERHRIVHRFWSALLPLARDWRALHFVRDSSVAPGWFRHYAGSTAEHLAAGCRDVADGGFDLVIANHVLQQVPDDVAAVRAMLRIAGESGIVQLTVPSPLHRWDSAPAEPGRDQLYGADFPIGLCRALGAVACIGVLGQDDVTQTSDWVYLLSLSGTRIEQLGRTLQRHTMPVVRFAW